MVTFVEPERHREEVVVACMKEISRRGLGMTS
jgi:hypothetical protein